jgi:hypothetical protein
MRAHIHAPPSTHARARTHTDKYLQLRHKCLFLSNYMAKYMKNPIRKKNLLFFSIHSSISSASSEELDELLDTFFRFFFFDFLSFLFLLCELFWNNFKCKIFNCVIHQMTASVV